MKRGRIILGAITGLLSVGAVFAFKAAKFLPTPNVYYFTAQNHCITIGYTTDLSGSGSTFTIPNARYYTAKVSSTSCSHPLATGVTVAATSPE